MDRKNLVLQIFKDRREHDISENSDSVLKESRYNIIVIIM